MIIYVKNPKESTDEILELISMFNNVARYKIQYVKINCISIYQHKESENEIFKDTTDCIIRNIKYLERGLTKDVQNLYKENYQVY